MHVHVYAQTGNQRHQRSLENKDDFRFGINKAPFLKALLKPFLMFLKTYLYYIYVLYITYGRAYREQAHLGITILLLSATKQSFQVEGTPRAP